MQEENSLDLSDAYDFDFEGGVNNVYLFETDGGMRYQVKFVPSGYLWESNPFYADYTHEFAFFPIENNTGKNPPLDKKVPITIALIFSDFFRENKNIVVYICDSSDSKQAVRFRKFNSWFNYFKGRTFLKMDMNIEDKQEGIIYTSLIMRADNPYMDKVMIEFKNIMLKAQEGDK
jgi:hypothetical protein